MPNAGGYGRVYQCKVIKLGDSGSYGIVIPHKIVRRLGIGKGTLMNVSNLRGRGLVARVADMGEDDGKGEDT